MTFPKKCDNGWLSSFILNTGNITYNGPNLSNTGVDTGDNLNVVLQKIDEEFDPVTLVQTLLYTIQNNPSLQVTFCTLVNACSTTTTTTSTTTEAPTTTTTTTTDAPGPYAYGALYGISYAASCGASGPSTTRWSTDPIPPVIGTFLYQNYAMTNPVIDGWYHNTTLNITCQVTGGLGEITDIQSC
jgi:hypothetical protein